MKTMTEVQLIQNATPIHPNNQFLIPIKILLANYHNTRDEIDTVMKTADMTELETLYLCQNAGADLKEIAKKITKFEKDIEEVCNNCCKNLISNGFRTDGIFEIVEALSNKSINVNLMQKYYPVQYKKLLAEETSKLNETYKPTIAKAKKLLKEREILDVVEQSVTSYKIKYCDMYRGENHDSH
jgi:hypothetical protein